jgi:hypothetical protein
LPDTLDSRIAAHEPKAPGVTPSRRTADLFATGGDEENRAAVAAVPREKLDLVGVAVHAPRNAADEVAKGARMHPIGALRAREH